MPVDVSVVKIDSSKEDTLKEKVIDGVKKAMELAKWKDYITEGADVSVKLNLTLDILLPGSNTSPWVTRGVIETILDYVGDIYLIDCDQLLFSADKAFKVSRIEPILNDYKKVSWYNLSKNKYRAIDIEGSNNIKILNVPEILFDTEFITIPVMKTHFRSTISGALKNQFGCLDDMKNNYHSFLPEILYNINFYAKPRFAVLDATVCMEGNGPKSGSPKTLDRILASSDIVALDTVSAIFMGFDPAKIDHINYAARRNLGTNRIENINIVGEDIRNMNFNFEPAKENFVAIVEAKLRESF